MKWNRILFHTFKSQTSALLIILKEVVIGLYRTAWKPTRILILIILIAILWRNDTSRLMVVVVSTLRRPPPRMNTNHYYKMERALNSRALNHGVGFLNTMSTPVKGTRCLPERTWVMYLDDKPPTLFPRGPQTTAKWMWKNWCQYRNAPWAI